MDSALTGRQDELRYLVLCKCLTRLLALAPGPRLWTSTCELLQRHASHFATQAWYSGGRVSINA